MTRMISEEQADGKVAEVYADIKDKFGMIPNFFKAQAAIDPDWLEVNWQRVKVVMLSSGGLDRKTRELLAFAVSQTHRCEYCSLAHETMARMNGASAQEVDQTRQIVELFSSFTAIAAGLRVPCDISPDMLADKT